MSTAVDPFGGPGGWDIAAADLGIDVEGIEFDHAACGTRRAAGLRTIEADVAQCDPHIWADVDGLIMSPPCQAFSSAGKGKGRDHITTLAAAIHRRDWAARPDPDPKVWLVLEVGRWYEAIRPEWVALEQVPAVLPLWEAYAAMLRADGYSVWCGLLCAADYGVPQTRTRAILIASRTRPAHPPAATHAERPEASLFGTLQPWVTMADALGWPASFAVELQRGRIPATEPAPTIRAGTKGSGPNLIVHAEFVNGGQPNATRRGIDEPAPTILASADNGDSRFIVHTNRGQGCYDTPSGRQEIDATDHPAPTLTAKSGGQWTIARPATTVQCDPRIAPPGHRDRAGGEPQFGEGTIRLTVQQALVLQGFPVDYPVQGTKTKQFEQVGNAIPPPLAHAILAQLVDAQEAAA